MELNVCLWRMLHVIFVSIAHLTNFMNNNSSDYFQLVDPLIVQTWGQATECASIIWFESILCRRLCTESNIE